MCIRDSLNGNENGQGSAFNDRGQLAFNLIFDDQGDGVTSGVFIATIPEPHTAAAFVLISVFYYPRRSR